MLTSSIFLASFASLAAVVTASPLAARDDSACQDSWLFKDNVADTRGSGALPNHPVWGKKFDTRCACAQAIDSASGPEVALLAFDNKSGTCYPLGISGGSDHATKFLALSEGPILLAATNYTQGTTNPPTAKDCSTIKMRNADDGFFSLNPQSDCLELAHSTVSDFVVYDADAATCKVCNWDAAPNHSIGQYVRIPGPGGN
ncbi:hypothetical protein HKX48_002580 [Thoreauomyces humboldtii]|nr:hypothetical protein HKX48_002580 [Thoreauomyces humboldtii]